MLIKQNGPSLFHHHKGVIFDILIDSMIDEQIIQNPSLHEEKLQEIETIMNKLDKINLLKFVKVLLSQFEEISDDEKEEECHFEEIFLTDK